MIDGNLPAPAFTRSYQLPDGSTFHVPFSAGVIRNAAGATVNINLSRPNPAFGSLSVQKSIAQSWYDAMLVEVKKRMSKGFATGLSYTMARADSTTGTGDGGGAGTEGPFGGGNFQNQFDPGSNRAASALDQRHPGNLYFTWDLPWKKSGMGALDAVFRGWALNSIFTGETGSRIRR